MNKLNLNAVSGPEAQYDAQVKKLLSQKLVLSWILKKTVSELKLLSHEEIEKCIEGTPDISKTAVDYNAFSREIRGDQSESNIIGEGLICYDIRFRVCLPEKNNVIVLIINIEAQKDYYPGYAIESRGIYYCARMLSSQKETEFIKSNYNDIKKVYSIWICMNSPSHIGNAISSYAIQKRDFIGRIPDKKNAYDKLELILITLNQSKTNDEFLQKLQILLSVEFDAQTKIKKLKEEHRINVGPEIEEVFDVMCNLSYNILQKGVEQGKILGQKEGRINTLVDLVKKNLLSLSDAAAILHITEEEFKNYF